ncbi:MAG: NAD(P)/FAD-dependent oxidoreductase [Spirochaetes bacterium]|nr:NAD(P)/FAD-dependent oxidoreductase [Spirochaetota bacterium]
MFMRKKVIIIGAGIAGLSAGCYLQMNGYDTEIFEMSHLPGGLCRSWKRQDYTFDGCLHWLVGSSPTVELYDLWEELIEMKNIQFVDHEEFMRIQDRDGKYISIFTDAERLEKEMLTKAPSDKKIIMKFTRAIRKYARFKLPLSKPIEIFNLRDGLRFMFDFFPYLFDFYLWQRLSARKWALKCKNRLLKKTFEWMFMTDMSILFMIFNLAWMHKKGAGYPIGGSQLITDRLTGRYLQLGGKIHYSSKATKVITEHNKAGGIVLADGTLHQSDIVVSAADGYYTIFEMLEGKYTNHKIKKHYKDGATFPAHLQVSFGIKRKLDFDFHSIVFILDQGLVIDDDTTATEMWFRIYHFDPTLAPEGKTVIEGIIPTYHYQYWVELRKNDPEKYIGEKERIAKALIDILEKRLGNIKKHVEVIDVTTPVTVIENTNNWKGAFEGWLITGKMGPLAMKKYLPGLKDFYMAGHWIETGGGVPNAMRSGRGVAQIICKKDRKKFHTTKP